MAIKKQWYEIVAPKFFDEKKIGETLSSDPKRLIGRTVSVSLADITGDYSKFYLKLLLRINNVDDKAHTELIGHECMHERIYRMIHRYMRRVDCIQEIVTKDNRKLKIKIVFVLVKRVNTSIKNSARAGTKKLIEAIIKENTFEDYIKMMISGELQNKIRKEISKIYPVGNIEIRKSELLGEKIAVELKQTKKERKNRKAKQEDKEKKESKPETEGKKEDKKPEAEKETKAEGKKELKKEGKQPEENKE